MKTPKDFIILIAEDDDGHAELIREDIEDSGLKNDVIRFSNGEEVWFFLSKTGINDVRRKNERYLLLLDINMPKMDGLEVLKRMKSDKVLKEIPVMILTTTDDPREVEACYKLGCDSYITKPIDVVKFSACIKQLGLLTEK